MLKGLAQKLLSSPIANKRTEVLYAAVKVGIVNCVSCLHHGFIRAREQRLSTNCAQFHE